MVKYMDSDFVFVVLVHQPSFAVAAHSACTGIRTERVCSVGSSPPHSVGSHPRIMHYYLYYRTVVAAAVVGSPNVAKIVMEKVVAD